jgi:hypothetical protein
MRILITLLVAAFITACIGPKVDYLGKNAPLQRTATLRTELMHDYDILVLAVDDVDFKLDSRHLRVMEGVRMVKVKAWGTQKERRAQEMWLKFKAERGKSYTVHIKPTHRYIYRKYFFTITDDATGQVVSEEVEKKEQPKERNVFER